MTRNPQLRSVRKKKPTHYFYDKTTNIQLRSRSYFDILLSPNRNKSTGVPQSS